MSRPALAAPDIEAAAVSWLQGWYTAARVGTQRPFGTDWAVTDDLLIQVELVDGTPPRALVLDGWMLAVSVWHPDAQRAALVAGEVAGLLNSWAGRHAGILIYDVTATRPRSAPDPRTSVPRYLLTASGTSRLAGS